jgi:hypothetical protein
MAAEHRDHLASRQSRRAALTQPSPRPASRSATSQSRQVRGRVESLPRYHAWLLLPCRPPKRSLATRDRRRSSSRLPGQTPGPRETSCLQYSAGCQPMPGALTCARGALSNERLTARRYHGARRGGRC